jgi:hypothetical protein
VERNRLAYEVEVLAADVPLRIVVSSSVLVASSEEEVEAVGYAEV